MTISELIKTTAEQGAMNNFKWMCQACYVKYDAFLAAHRCCNRVVIRCGVCEDIHYSVNTARKCCQPIQVCADCDRLLTDCKCEVAQNG